MELDVNEQSAAQKSTYVSVGVNLGLSAVQVGLGVFAGSHGLIADGIHSLSDLISDFVVLGARHYSKMDADEDHPYGHHRYENAASLFLGVLLLAVAAGMVASAVINIQNHENIGPVKWIALWVAIAAIICKELLFRYMLRVAERIKSSLLIANAWHARSDAASSLVAAFGIGGNLLGFSLLDPIAALIVGFIVGKMGWKFAWEALHDLMDRTVDEKILEEVRQILLSSPGVSGLHDLKARRMADLILIDVHLEVDGTKTVREGHDIALEARSRVLKNPQILNLMTHVDPV
jgi:cation diffusion facilitator family transporter